MTERIGDPADSPSMLVRHLRHGTRAGLHRPRDQLIRIIDHQQGPAGRTADRERAEPRPGSSARGHPERSLPDGQLGDDLISLTDPMNNPGAERSLIKRDRRRRALDPQLRLNARHRRSRYRPARRRRPSTAATDTTSNPAAANYSLRPA
jgi:hypothetical protein